MARTPAKLPAEQEEALDAVLAAARVFVALAARSIASVAPDVTLPQFRALVVVAYNGAQRTTDLATELGVSGSTATRMVDRLVRRGLVFRTPHPDDARATCVELSDSGHELISQVVARRRKEFGQILDRMPAKQRPQLVSVLESLRQAAGEAPEAAFTAGW